MPMLLSRLFYQARREKTGNYKNKGELDRFLLDSTNYMRLLTENDKKGEHNADERHHAPAFY